MNRDDLPTGDVCPYCGAMAIDSLDLNLETEIIEVEWVCGSCEQEWNDVYEYIAREER